jgi:hypothetical protein
MIEDSELDSVVLEMDECLLQFALKHKLPALMVSSIVLSRLVWMNKLTGSADDFVKLLSTVIDTIHKEESTTTGSLH